MASAVSLLRARAFLVSASAAAFSFSARAHSCSRERMPATRPACRLKEPINGRGRLEPRLGRPTAQDLHQLGKLALAETGGGEIFQAI